MTFRTLPSIWTVSSNICPRNGPKYSICSLDHRQVGQLQQIKGTTYSDKHCSRSYQLVNITFHSHNKYILWRVACSYLARSTNTMHEVKPAQLVCYSLLAYNSDFIKYLESCHVPISSKITCLHLATVQLNPSAFCNPTTQISLLS